MATIRLVPSTYSRSNTNYVTVTDPNNMYNNTDHTSNYTSIRGRNSSQTSRLYYCYISGFNFDDVPSGATVNSFSVKIRAYKNSYQRTGETYRPKLASTASSGSVISNTTLSSDLTTSSGGEVYTFPTSGLTWNNLTSYGSGFTIVIPLNPSSNQYPYVYVYGAEIEVNYTIANPVTVNSIIVSGTGTINPSGSTSTYEGAEYTLTITPSDTSEEVTATRDGVDITSSLVPHYPSTGGTLSQTAGQFTTELSASGANFYTSSSSTGNYFNYAVGHTAESPGSTSTSYNTYVKDGGSNTATGWAWYPFDFSGLPSNATIESVEVKCYGACESTTHDSTHKANITLYSGNTLKSTEQYFTSTSNSVITISNPGTWTRAELQSAKLKFEVAYYGGRLFGITWNIVYSTPGGTDPEYYTYTFTVGSTNSTIQVTIGAAGPYIPDPEDPTKTYYSLTISSINAATDPENGTTRVEAGTDHVITITPTDPLLTLALDNGVDISDKLVGSGPPSNTYTVTTQVSGASYGFPLNSATGYYTSNNDARSNSAAVCRVNFDLETDCLVTIEYINYAEATYDYGIFGQPNQTLGTTYTVDSNVYHACSSSSDNKSTAQTLTYSLTAGTPYIDIKYRKDQATDSYNDNLQWKITSIEATSGGGDYTYTIEDIDQKHSLVFIFGDVTYYFINSSGAGDVRLFPDGQQVKLPGDSYRLNIVPTNVSAQVTITDNGTNVTSQLEKEEGYDKQGNPAVSYTYRLSNIAATHNLIITCGTVSTKIYIKNGNTWSAYTKAYIKMNGTWVQDANLTEIFHSGGNYKRGS